MQSKRPLLHRSWGLSSSKRWQFSTQRIMHVARRWAQLAIFAGAALLNCGGVVQAAKAAPAVKRVVQPTKLLHFAPYAHALMTTSLVVGKGGNIWIGTESAGLWHCVLTGNTVRDGDVFSKNVPKNQYALPVNIYTAALDAQGRLWLGSLRHGVGVISGDKFQSYQTIPGLGRDAASVNGPLGQRVFAIAVSPVDSSIWIGTDSGLSRYEPKFHRWQYYTMADGLPSDAISALAFAPDGTLYVGLQADGLAVGKANDHYRHWVHIGGPLHVPLTAFGKGLPCPYVNAIAIQTAMPGDRKPAPSYRVYVGTDDGLAIGLDGGRNWQFIRGRNYFAKDKFMYPTLRTLGNFKRVASRFLMSSDYITTIAVEPNGPIWIGHRKTGVDLLTLGRRKLAHAIFTPIKALNGDYISAMAVMPQGRTLVGVYGGGVYVFQSAAQPHAEPDRAPRRVAAHEVFAPLPRPASAPTAKSLKGLIQRIKAGLAAPADVAVLREDWSTQGDWLGHYGVNYARLCCGTANYANAEEQFFGGLGACRILREQSPYPQFFNQGDWAAYLAWANSPLRSTLYFPVARMRVEGEWNDAGGRYPRYTDGPDMWLKVKIPRGLYVLSFYLHNKDGQTGMNKIRDYLAMVYPKGKNPTQALKHEKPLAVSRIYQFFGGEYCRFLLKGPGDYQVRLKRNYGFWMPVQGMFLDRLSGRKLDAGYNHLDGLPLSTYRPPPFSPSKLVAASAAWQLWKLAGQTDACSRGDLPLRRTVQVAAYRYAYAHHFPNLLLRRWRWRLHLWNHNDSLRFNSVMRKLNHR